ncbi:thiol-disulfide oxidoreductase DCC family protein [Paraglaciecola aestuariivivens]
MNEVSVLTIFYDGFCPLCQKEMNKLAQLDNANKISFVDIQQPNFAKKFPELDWQALNARIHGKLADGTIISGLDVMYLAWVLVDKAWVYAPLRWPLTRHLADYLYRVFAKHRYFISYLLTGQKRCAKCWINSESKDG